MMWAYAVVQAIVLGAMPLAAAGPKCDANMYFEQILQHPQTIEHLNGLLAEVSRDNPDKTREEVMAIYERERRTYILELHRQARQLADNECGKIPDKGTARRI